MFEIPRCVRVTHICICKLTIIGSDNDLVAWTAPSHYLNQCWNMFIHENAFGDVSVWEMVFILFLPQCDNYLKWSWSIQTYYYPVNHNTRLHILFASKDSINNKSAMVETMAWHTAGNNPLPEPMMTQFTDVCDMHHRASMIAYEIIKKELPAKLLIINIFIMNIQQSIFLSNRHSTSNSILCTCYHNLTKRLVVEVTASAIRLINWAFIRLII